MHFIFINKMCGLSIPLIFSGLLFILFLNVLNHQLNCIFLRMGTVSLLLCFLIKCFTSTQCRHLFSMCRQMISVDVSAARASHDSGSEQLHRFFSFFIQTLTHGCYFYLYDERPLRSYNAILLSIMLQRDPFRNALLLKNFILLLKNSNVL